VSLPLLLLLLLLLLWWSRNCRTRRRRNIAIGKWQSCQPSTQLAVYVPQIRSLMHRQLQSLADVESQSKRFGANRGGFEDLVHCGQRDAWCTRLHVVSEQAESIAQF
jgi:hypothetical protein